MNILWISFIGSWTQPLLNAIKSQSRIGIIIPVMNNKKGVSKEEKDGIIYYYLFLSEHECYRNMSQRTFEKYDMIIKDFKPDIIHVHGTEKNLAQIQNFLFRIPIVVSIQGILGGCTRYTLNYLEKKVVHKFKTLKNLLGRGGFDFMYRTCVNGQKYEPNILSNGKYFIGRTQWDKAYVQFCNPKVKYFQGEELLREEFYKKQHSWRFDECQKNSIFMPAGFNPIKGLHWAIESVNLLKQYFPDVRLTVPGIYTDARRFKLLNNILTGEEYLRYALHLISIHKLERNIKFLPRLNAAEMIEQMQHAHVFLSPTSIDNSPNAVGEAMMIGTPVVSTPVGGITSFLKDEDNALLAPAGDPYMMAYQIKRIFEDKHLAETLSEHAFQTALKRHDVKKTTEQYLDIYSQVIQLHKISYHDHCV